MLHLEPGRRDGGRPLQVLCIGAHSDDIEIGCGGTLLRLLAEHPGTHVHWWVLSAVGERAVEAAASAADFVAAAGSHEIELTAFRESYFPYVAADIKDHFNDVRSRVDPDIVLCHRRLDEHQDHRTVGQLVWNTFRDHLVLEYEIPKYEGDLGNPNVFVPLSTEVAERKIELIVKHFASQRNRTWFRPETFAAMMSLRGVESGSLHAEGFHARKILL